MAYLSFKYSQLCEYHKKENHRAEARVIIRDWDDTTAWYKLSNPKDPVRAAYHARMAEKYRKASDYPWIPIESDPPKPN
jgi:hypothetical protein